MNQLSPLTVPLVASGVVPVFEGFGADDPMWQGAGARSVSVEVAFAMPFAAPPHVQVAVSTLDADQSRNLRYRLEVEDVGRKSFLVTSHVWDDTRIGRLAVSWIAIGEQAAGTGPGRAGRSRAKR